MATILKAGPTTNGCSNCDPMYDGGYMPGYVILDALDDEGVYEFIGRCWYCNHRDRPAKGETFSEHLLRFPL